MVWCPSGNQWHSSGVSTGTGTLQHLCWHHGLRDQVSPQHVCQWHQAVPSVTTLLEGMPGWRGDLCASHEIQQGQVQDPASGQSQAQLWVRWGAEWGEVFERVHQHIAQCELSVKAQRPESQPHPGLHHNSHDFQIEGRDWSLYSALVRTLLEHCVHVWGLQHKKDIDLASPEQGSEDDHRTWVSLLGGERVGATQPEEKVLGRPYSSLPVPKGGLPECWRRIFQKEMLG